MADKIYQLEYLPIARHDMVEIARYISLELSNPSAAEKLADEMIQAAESLTGFRYIYPVHHVSKPLNAHDFIITSMNENYTNSK